MVITYDESNILHLMKIHYLQLSILLVSWLVPVMNTQAQGYISPFKYDNGKTIMKSRDEIRNEESNRSANKNYANYPTEFDKPKDKIKADGEIWVDGYCRYRPPSTSKSRYNDDVTESEYCRAVYPNDTLMQTDDFMGGGSIPWAENAWFGKVNDVRSLQDRIKNAVNDGLPFLMYDSLQRMSAYSVATSVGYKKGREYEFSRSVSFWVKRTSGPEKMYLKLSAEYPFTNGEDRTDLEVNDKGQYKISRFCSNCKSPQFKEIESGKSKAWKVGDWNVITIHKDEFNTVTAYVNGEELCRYQLSALPITVRFARFRLEMPYKWEKEKLDYHVGRVTSISYPMKKK